MVPNMVPNMVLTVLTHPHPWTACFSAITPGSVRVVNMAASSPGLESWARRFILDREKRWNMNQNEPKWTNISPKIAVLKVWCQVGPNLDAPRGAKWQRPKPLGSNSVGVPLKPTRPERSKSRKWIELGSKIWNILELLSWEGYSWGSYIDIRRPRPSPRQGRRLGPPQVWNLSFLATGIPRPHQWLFMGVQRRQ